MEANKNDTIRYRGKHDHDGITRIRDLLVQAEKRLASEGYSHLSVQDIKNYVFLGSTLRKEHR